MVMQVSWMLIIPNFQAEWHRKIGGQIYDGEWRVFIM